MRVIILGSGAGGGFPQWNCNCSNCRAVRAGAPGFTSRTQSSLAVTADGIDWLILNASPDLPRQIAQTPALAPAAAGAARSSPIKAVVLTNGDVDHVAGLLSMREEQPFSLYASRRVLDILQANSILNVLAPRYVARIELPLSGRLQIQFNGIDIGLAIEAFAAPGKVPLYLERTGQREFGTEAGDTLGLRIIETASGKAFFYIPACART